MRLKSFFQSLLLLLGLKKRSLKDVPHEFISIINEKIAFYHTLNKNEQNRFVLLVYEFSEEMYFLGVGIDITLKDRVLASCSAIIPVFFLKGWHYN